jgi:hypothetical protein
VHGYRERTVADVPVDGRQVSVAARLRRMRCPILECTVQTFREQVPGLLDRYQQRTTRLAAQVSAVARGLARRAGARLAPVLGIGASRHALLRALLRIPLPELEVPPHRPALAAPGRLHQPVHHHLPRQRTTRGRHRLARRDRRPGHQPPCSGGEQRMLRITASLADGIPVDLRDTLTGLDDRNLQLLITAIRRASEKISTK